MTAGVSDTSANIPPMSLRSREIYDWRCPWQRRKIWAGCEYFRTFFEKKKLKWCQRKMIHRKNWSQNLWHCPFTFKISMKWNCWSNCHKNIPIRYYAVVESWRKETNVKSSLLDYYWNQPGSSSSMGLADHQVTYVRSISVRSLLLRKHM